ncbi:MAG: carbohydrate ABC transporter permease [Chloroflexi bacterium]|nr:carbohydrate ABC transporter permease [Chloroflexota bacterium]
MTAVAGATARKNASRSSGVVRRWLRRLPAYTLLIVCSVILLFPLYVTAVFSLHPLTEFLKEGAPSLWPSFWQWDNYFASGEGVSDTPVGRYLFNSFVMSTVITLGQLITATLSAYAFAFLKFPGRNALFVAFLATMMVPLEVSIIPNFQTMQWLDAHFTEQAWLSWTHIRFIDGFPGLVAPFLATGFGTFLLRQYFMTIPRELLDAAEMDGYGHLRTLIHVVMPLGKGALATLAIFAFLQAWNQYLWPLLVTNDPNMRTVQIGIAAEAANISRINVAFAGTIMAFLPMLLLVVAFQRYLVRGLFGGSVKG